MREWWGQDKEYLFGHTHMHTLRFNNKRNLETLTNHRFLGLTPRPPTPNISTPSFICRVTNNVIIGSCSNWLAPLLTLSLYLSVYLARSTPPAPTNPPPPPPPVDCPRFNNESSFFLSFGSSPPNDGLMFIVLQAVRPRNCSHANSAVRSCAQRRPWSATLPTSTRNARRSTGA